MDVQQTTVERDNLRQWISDNIDNFLASADTDTLQALKDFIDGDNMIITQKAFSAFCNTIALRAIKFADNHKIPRDEALESLLYKAENDPEVYVVKSRITRAEADAS